MRSIIQATKVCGPFIHRLITHRLLIHAATACLITTFVAASPPARSQEQNAPQTVVITGSRIRTDPLNQPAPLATVTDQDIAKSGTTTIGDVLQRMTSSGGGLNTKFNTSGNVGFPPDQGGVGAGASTIDLRHLGAKRVLVLVDGIRWVNESSASGVSSATDLNTIPTSIIDHVEVLQDGASSVYGSDAIAGVVNIITKKSFSGLQFQGYGGAFDKGDGQNQQWSISTGSASETFNTFLDLSYAKQKDIRSGDRAISAFPTPGVGHCTNRCSSGTPSGRFLFTDPNTGIGHSLTLNSGVTGIPRYDPTQTDAARTDDFHAFTTADRFNFQPYNFILTPSERFSVYAQGDTHLTDHATFYLKGLFNNRRSTNQAAPEPLFIGPEAGNGVGNLLDVTPIDKTNPYNPFGFTLDLNTGPGGTDYVVFRRPVEGGPRVFKQDVNTFYFGGGFRGDFELASRDFFWDVNAAWSRNEASQITHGSYNALKIQNALGPAGHDSAGNLVCGVPDAGGLVASPIPSCVPLNVFGGAGTITPAMLTYIQPTLHDTSDQELRDFTANLTGTIVQLPAGGLDFAVGFEHRKQSGSYQPDSIYVSGESAGVPSLPTSGEFSVDEYYGELRVPLLRGVPGADLLQVSGAVRASDYSIFGSDTTTKFGLNWRPVSDLLFRGTFAQGVRAPGIGELFGTFARFDTTIQDPCSDYTGTSGPAKPAATQANCRALGVPASYTQANPQISVVTGGNPLLIPETSDGYTAGLVFSPRWAQGTSWSENLSFEFTWYRITLDRTILARDAQVQLDGCVQTLDPVLCGGIGRTGGGNINRFNNQLINIGGTRTKGYDINLHYALPELSFGRIAVTWANTRLSTFVDSIQTSTGFQDVPREGTERGDPAQAYPKWKSSLTGDWSLRDFAASLTVRYTDSVVERCRGLVGLGLCSDYNTADDNLSTNKMDATAYVDLQATWKPAALNDAWAFTLGVNNLFNQDAPFCFSCASNSFDASTYDVPGVFWYARVVAHFGNKE